MKRGQSGRKILESTIKTREALFGYIKDNKWASTAQIVEHFGTNYHTTANHLDYLRRNGDIVSSKRAEGASVWIAINDKPTQEKATMEALEDRKKVLAYIRDHGPCNRAQIMEALDMQDRQTSNLCKWLRTFGHIELVDSCWEYVRGLASTKQTPAVEVKPERYFLEPGPVITEIRDGVKYTYSGAPKGRFDVDVQRGAGVISKDNPRLVGIVG